MVKAMALLLFLSCSAISLAPALATRSYKIIVTDVKVEILHPDYFGPETWIKHELINKTTNKFTLKADIRRSLPVTVQSKWQTYERYGRNLQYVPSLHAEGTVCRDLERHVKGEPIFKGIPYSAFGFTGCPVKQGNYSGTAILNNDDFPVVIPGHFWRLVNVWLDEKKTIFKLKGDVILQRAN